MQLLYVLTILIATPASRKTKIHMKYQKISLERKRDRSRTTVSNTALYEKESTVTSQYSTVF